MEIPCHHCRKDISSYLAQLGSSPVGRGESCPHCRSDVRVCLLCKFYDRSCYNECSEPQAERVVDKARANFCDYFTLKSTNGPDASSPKKDALAELEKLFSKD